MGAAFFTLFCLAVGAIFIKGAFFPSEEPRRSRPRRVPRREPGGETYSPEWDALAIRRLLKNRYPRTVKYERGEVETVVLMGDDFALRLGWCVSLSVSGEPRVYQTTYDLLPEAARIKVGAVRDLSPNGVR